MIRPLSSMTTRASTRLSTIRGENPSAVAIIPQGSSVGSTHRTGLDVVLRASGRRRLATRSADDVDSDRRAPWLRILLGERPSIVAKLLRQSGGCDSATRWKAQAPGRRRSSGGETGSFYLYPLQSGSFVLVRRQLTPDRAAPLAAGSSPAGL